MNVKLPPGAAPIVKSLYEESMRRGVSLFAVGGCVRDWILGLEIKDLDFVAEQDLAPLARWCVSRWGGRLEIFGRFLTMRVFTDCNLRIDFARARQETYAEPAALPVVKPGSLARDLLRRDFTINAMAARLDADGFGEVFDPHRGMEDLRRKALRVLHPNSFRDDPTRMCRAARFACRFGFRLDPQTEAHRRHALKAGWARRLSRERIRGELVRILEEKRPICALKKLKSWSLSELFHPRLAWPADLAEGNGVWARLGMIAMHMGSPDGREFLESLHLERPVAHSLTLALEITREKAAPRIPIAPLTENVLRRSLKRVPESAFAPLFLNGADLRSLGLRPGPEYRIWLGRAAKAQWKGEFSTRLEALRWLQSNLHLKHRV